MSANETKGQCEPEKLLIDAKTGLCSFKIAQSAFNRVIPKLNSQQVFERLPSLLNNENNHDFENESQATDPHQNRVDEMFEAIFAQVSEVYKVLRPTMEDRNLFSHPISSTYETKTTFHDAFDANKIKFEEVKVETRQKPGKRSSCNSELGYTSTRKCFNTESKYRKASESAKTVSCSPEIPPAKKEIASLECDDDPASFTQSEILAKFCKLKKEDISIKNENKRESKLKVKNLDKISTTSKLVDFSEGPNSVASEVSAPARVHNLSPDALSQCYTSDEPLVGSNCKRLSKLGAKGKKKKGNLVSDTLPVNISIMDTDSKTMLHEKKYNELVDELTNTLYLQ